MAKADGVVTDDEVAAFKQVFHVPPHEMRNVGRLFDRARRDAHGFEPYARQIAGLFKDNPAVLEDLLDGLFHIAKADNVVHPKEIGLPAPGRRHLRFRRRRLRAYPREPSRTRRGRSLRRSRRRARGFGRGAEKSLSPAHPRESPRWADRPGPAAGVYRRRQRQAGGDQRRLRPRKRATRPQIAVVRRARTAAATAGRGPAP